MIGEAAMLAAYAVLSTSAMVIVKRAATAPRLAPALRILAVAGLLYCAAVALLLVLLRSGDASDVFPVAVGAAMVTTTVAGVRLHHEALTPRKLAGTALVIAGMALLLAGAA